MMRSIFSRIFLMIVFFLLAYPVHGAVVHLNSGESLSGRIQKLDEQALSLESDRGFGVLHIERADIRLIEFDNYHPNLNRKFGMGFYQKNVVLNRKENSGEYEIGALSFKNWLSGTDAVEFQWGYSETRDNGVTYLSVLAMQLRFLRVFLQEGNHHLYWAVGVGHLSVIDKEEEINTTGGSIQAVIGVELFPLTFPNIGISAEIGASNQSISDRVSLSVISPAFAIRYYF